MGDFNFNSEQIELLKSLKGSLNSEEALFWYKNESEAETKTQSILKKVSFVNGEDLTPQELDELFSQTRWISRNRNLSKLLYRTNGLKEFNAALRDLLYGTDVFPKRVDRFFNLKSMGEQTLSQLLVSFDSTQFAFVTWYTKEILQIDSTQEESAMRDALKKFNIPNKDTYLERTQEYLRDFVIFEKIKEVCNLEKYTQVNNLLWFGRKKQEDEDEPQEFEKNYTSVSIEKDLRDFLANNLHLIEKDLTLIGKEFDTGTAGRIDLFCKTSNGEKIVVELKKGKKSDEIVGQILRYIGWVNKIQHTNARGIIIVNEPDEKLEYALFPLKEMIQLKYYKVKFEVSDKFDSNSKAH